MLAPIVLFTYNRLHHTQKTVEALQNNKLANQSRLFIYSDQAQYDQDVVEVNKVRAYLNQISGFKKITKVFHDENKGLAASIMDGVSDVLKEYESVIVLEDDLETSPYFLTFMNKALDNYSHEEVWSVAGYTPKISIPKDYCYDTYLAHRNCSWGWATWKQNWEKTDWEVNDFDDFFVDKNKRSDFERGGNDLSIMLLKQQKKIIHSWSIRFNYAAFNNNLPSVYPTQSYVKNMGVDGSGTHMKKSGKYDSELNFSDNSNMLFAPSNIIDSRISVRFKKFYNTSLYRKAINWYYSRREVRSIKTKCR
ncbi:sugar transferase [Saccharicrinis sp. GN24d3]